MAETLLSAFFSWLALRLFFRRKPERCPARSPSASPSPAATTAATRRPNRAAGPAPRTRGLGQEAETGMSLWLSSGQDKTKHRRHEPVKKRPDSGFIGGAFFLFLESVG